MGEKIFEIQISTFCNGVKYASVTFEIEQWKHMEELFVGGISFDISTTYGVVKIETLGSMMELTPKDCPNGGLTSDPSHYDSKLDWDAQIIGVRGVQM